MSSKKRKPNHIKPKRKQQQLGTKVTTMKVVKNPVVGQFYAIDTADNTNMEICLFSGRLVPAYTVDSWHGGGLNFNTDFEPVIFEKIQAGSIVCYFGLQFVDELKGLYHKIGHDEYFGFVKPKHAIFYDLGISQ